MWKTSQRILKRLWNEQENRYIPWRFSPPPEEQQHHTLRSIHWILFLLLFFHIFCSFQLISVRPAQLFVHWITKGNHETGQYLCNISVKQFNGRKKSILGSTTENILNLYTFVGGWRQAFHKRIPPFIFLYKIIVFPWCWQSCRPCSGSFFYPPKTLRIDNIKIFSQWGFSAKKHKT